MPSRGLLLTVWPALVLAAGCTLPVSNRGVTAGPDDGAAGGRIAFPINAGSIGGTAHIILPDEDELAPGFGTGVAWEAIWIVQGRI